MFGRRRGGAVRSVTNIYSLMLLLTWVIESHLCCREEGRQDNRPAFGNNNLDLWLSKGPLI